MGDFVVLIKNIHDDKEQFQQLVERMEPIINKYIKLLYKDDNEDIRSELTLSLWEAVLKLKYVNNDGQCITFLCNALRNKFYELYRNSKKIHDNQYDSDTIIMENIPFEETEYHDVITKTDMEKYLKKYTGLKHQIYTTILFDCLSDYEIANKYNVSRQYVHRLRKLLYSELQEKYLKIKASGRSL